MNLLELQKKLMAAARAHPPDDRVPYAFEQRVLARLHSSSRVPRVDAWGEWARALWCSAGVCAAVTVLVGVWSWNPPRSGDSTPSSTASSPSFTQELEQAIWAGGDDEAGW